MEIVLRMDPDMPAAQTLHKAVQEATARRSERPAVFVHPSRGFGLFLRKPSRSIMIPPLSSCRTAEASNKHVPLPPALPMISTFHLPTRVDESRGVGVSRSCLTFGRCLSRTE